MEPSIHSDQNVEPDDDHFHSKVEDIEARFTLIPRWIITRPWCQVTRADAEPSTKAQQDRSGKKDIHFGAKSPQAEFLDPTLARKNNADQDDGYGQESHHGEESAAVQLKVASRLALGRVEGVEGENGEGNQDDEGGNDEGV